jgi:diaminopimelate decarboxylase
MWPKRIIGAARENRQSKKCLIMDYFNYKDGQLYAEDLSCQQLAKHYGTPSYIYSLKTLHRHFRAFDKALGDHPHLICYAVKASSNLHLLNALAALGAGFDVVSKGELYRVIKAGGSPKKTVFSGIGKTEEELRYALEQGIFCINVESMAELSLLNQVARDLGQKAPVSLRINPNVDAKTHPYISTGLKENKFGIEAMEALNVYKNFKQYPHLNFIGIDCHIGSQLTSTQPFLDALDKLLEMIKTIEGHGLTLKHLDLGGGLGVTYEHETPPEPSELASKVKERLNGYPLEIILEPGRAIAANAGILLTEVLYLKPHHDKNFAIVDAAMNDLLRPSLYNAYQNIVPVNQRTNEPLINYDIVGPVCETGDFLGKSRTLAIKEHDLLAVRGAGAYGFSMSSNYNSRPRVAEILVDGNTHTLIRRRETLDDLIHHEVF